MKIKLAFTLSEILITLSIIGVVAAMTLPSLINKQKDKANVAKLQKVYSILSQAHLYAVQENGDVNGWNIISGNSTSTEDIFSYYEPYLKIVKKCVNKPRCWAKNTKSLSGQMALWSGSDETAKIGLETYFVGFVLQDGVNISFNLYDLNYSFFGLPSDVSTPFALFYVDVNGNRNPNTFGRDIFGFAVDSKKGIIPFGVGNNSANCTKTISSNTSGYGCTYKVLQEKAINY